MKWKIKEIMEQEEKLYFTAFDKCRSADIGCCLLQTAQEHAYPVEIDITVGQHQLFHAALPGTTPDNSEWIRRKRNAVLRFERSSLQMEREIEESGYSIEDLFHVSSGDYAASGGSFPIRVKGVGVIGAITVSGLTSDEDHGLIVDVLTEYLLQC